MSDQTRCVSSLVASMAVVAAAVMVRRRQLRWGATAAETTDLLPGDELISDPDLAATRAITINAGADDVWPWIVQLGQGRGGFYSYDALENLVGGHIHSALQINPDWQHLDVGDAVRLAPEMALNVAVAKPPRTLVLRGGALPGTTIAPYDFTWTFHLSPVSATTTRLIVRERYAYTRWWALLMVEPLTAISFLMSRRMLHGIRDRAEQSDHNSEPKS
ncbi:SRPBCC family protein [Actinoplanes sp. CA-051413]|uniref:SRPBCC family protein n=1 Tax=Actinoplanes sp. CA-051413 TaxID=3239899 RepID=UPI003D9675EA